jgi:hypothetical protein
MLFVEQVEEFIMYRHYTLLYILFDRNSAHLLPDSNSISLRSEIYPLDYLTWKGDIADRINIDNQELLSMTQDFSSLDYLSVLY